MAGYHSALALHPGSSYGVAVLLGGYYPDAAKIAYDVFEIFQPAMDKVHAELATSRYGGRWSSSDEKGSATITVDKGTLYISEFFIDGIDILAKFHSPSRVPLRYVQPDKFR